MPIKCEDYNSVCVIALDGDLTGEISALVRKHVDERVEQYRIVDFVLDLDKTGFIDSEGLETLLWLKRKAEDLFGQLKLASADENVKKILEITRLEPRFDVQQDLPSALKNMR